MLSPKSSAIAMLAVELVWLSKATAVTGPSAWLRLRNGLNEACATQSTRVVQIEPILGHFRRLGQAAAYRAVRWQSERAHVKSRGRARISRHTG